MVLEHKQSGQYFFLSQTCSRRILIEWKMLQKHTANMITPDMFQEHMPKVMLPGAYWNIISGQSFSGAPYLTMPLHGRGGSSGISTLPFMW